MSRAWLFLALLCVAWYATVTLHVAVRGALDIRGMLARLRKRG